MKVNIIGQKAIERIIDQKIRVSIKELNRQMNIVYSKLDSLEEELKSLKIKVSNIE